MTTYTKNSPGAPDHGGLYSVGDLVVDSLNQVWKCVVPGRAAEWAPAPMQYRALTGATDLTAGDSGQTLLLNSTTAFAVTLPAMVAGLSYEFIVAAVPGAAPHTVTPADADKIVGRVFLSAGSGADGDTEDTAGGDVVNFVNGATVLGDRAKFWCNGTVWFVEAHAKVSTGITITG